MCEHCRKNVLPTKEVSANFSYKKTNDIESEARTSVSRVLTSEEFEDALNQLLFGMRVYAERSCRISEKEFKAILQQHISPASDFHQQIFESDQVLFDNMKVPILYN
jgi:hypothetical protein